MKNHQNNKKYTNIFKKAQFIADEFNIGVKKNRPLSFYVCVCVYIFFYSLKNLITHCSLILFIYILQYVRWKFFVERL